MPTYLGSIRGIWEPFFHREAAPRGNESVEAERLLLEVYFSWVKLLMIWTMYVGVLIR